MPAELARMHSHGDHGNESCVKTASLSGFRYLGAYSLRSSPSGMTTNLSGVLKLYICLCQTSRVGGNASRAGTYAFPRGPWEREMV